MKCLKLKFSRKSHVFGFSNIRSENTINIIQLLIILDHNMKRFLFFFFSYFKMKRRYFCKFNLNSALHEGLLRKKNRPISIRGNGGRELSEVELG